MIFQVSDLFLRRYMGLTSAGIPKLYGGRDLLSYTEPVYSESLASSTTTHDPSTGDAWSGLMIATQEGEVEASFSTE